MIVVYGIRERLDPLKARLADTLRRCLNDVLELPADRQALRFVALDTEDFYVPQSASVAYTVLEISLMEGRRVETKKRLIRSLFEQIESEVGIAPVDLEIMIREEPAHCWGIQGETGDEEPDRSFRGRS